MQSFPATYSDGRTAERQEARAVVGTAGLSILDRGGRELARWPFRGLRLAEEVFRDQPVRLRCDGAGDGRLSVRDQAILDALRPYAGVHPLVGGTGINVNTAPPWVLAQLLRGSEVSGFRPVEPEDVERIVAAREKGPICASEGAAADCTPLAEVLDGESLQPLPTERSTVFTVRAIARVFDVERRIESVVDRTDPSQIERLSWRVQ